MDTQEKVRFIQRLAEQNSETPGGNRIIWSRHATVELANENWQRGDIEPALRHCTIVEDYPTKSRRLPDCLVQSFTAHGAPFHAVSALDVSNDRLLMVTVYEPHGEEWNDDWRTRR